MPTWEFFLTCEIAPQGDTNTSSLPPKQVPSSPPEEHAALRAPLWNQGDAGQAWPATSCRDVPSKWSSAARIGEFDLFNKTGGKEVIPLST